MSEVRVRFAPSPTGAPHIGSLRTALFDWLWARHTGGKFILRVEDTDQKREVENGLEVIMESLRFLGLEWDEGPDIGGPYGPYVQSERLAIYQEHARLLVEKGAAYYCYCTAERLEQLRKEQQASGEAKRYDYRCRYLSPEEHEGHARAGDPYVVRLAVPREGTTTLHDFIHGNITIANRDVDDQVLLKSDGFPTYHLAVVVDDHLMKISHVMRADEWIPSFPKHILLYQAFGWEPPLIGHVPDVLGPDKKKLSKRHGATSVVQFREEGYLPEALVNFLARLGWSLNDKAELFTVDQLVQDFTLDKIEHSPAIFDHAKLDWMDGYYIRQLSDEEFAERALPYFTRAGLVTDLALVRQLAPMLKERIKKLSEAVPLVDYIFQSELEYDPHLLVGKKMTVASTLAALRQAMQVIETSPSFENEEQLEADLRAAAEQLGLKNQQFFGALRIAITGKTVSPPLVPSIRILGRAKSLQRLGRAVMFLEKLGPQPSDR